MLSRVDDCFERIEEMNMKNQKNLLAVALTLALVSCQTAMQVSSPSQEPGSTLPVTTAASSLKRVPVRFRIELNPQRFSIQQTAQAQAVKLEITGSDGQVYYANNVDANKFAYVGQGNTSIALTANVPETGLYTVKLGFYSNGSSEGLITELYSAFRTPVVGVVDINQRTSVTGGVLEEIRKQNASFYNDIDLNALQSFVDGFIGLDNGAFTHMGAATAATPRNPQDVDFKQLAHDIQTGAIATLTPQSGEAAAAGLYRFRKMPYQLNALPVAQTEDSFGVRGTLAIVEDAGQIRALFSHPHDQRLMGVELETDQQGRVTGESSPLFDVRVDNPISSPMVSTGVAKHNNVLTPVFYYLEAVNGAQNKRLVARSQSDGSLIWAYDFNENASRTTRFTPVVQPVNNDADFVYIAHNIQNAAHPSIVKLKSTSDSNQTPQVSASYLYAGSKGVPTYFNSSGALSPSGDKLYLVNGASQSPAEVVVLNTSDLSQAAIIDLSPYGVYPTSQYPNAIIPITASSPVVAADGTVYVSTFRYQSGYVGSYLHAINGTSSALKWSTPFTLSTLSDARPRYSPVVETVNGQNHIYVTTVTSSPSSGHVIHGVRDTGTSGERLWEQALPFNAVYSLDLTLVENYDGKSRILTGSADDGKIYLIDTESGSVEDTLYPGGDYTSGFAVFDKTIFFHTYNVNKTYLRAFQYPVKGLLPESRSAWPKAGGSLSNGGMPRIVNN